MNLKTLLPYGNKQGEVSRSDARPFSFLQREIDRLFDNFTRGWPTVGNENLMPRMDLSEDDKQIELTAELPGLEEKDVEVNLTDNILTIRGEKKSEKEEKNKHYQVSERSFGSFYRSIELPAGIDPSFIKADLSKGVLKVVVPKPPQSAAKKIEVKTST